MTYQVARQLWKTIFLLTMSLASTLVPTVHRVDEFRPLCRRRIDYGAGFCAQGNNQQLFLLFVFVYAF